MQNPGLDCSIELVPRPESDRPSLSVARIVIGGGRAFGSKEKFDELLEPLANKLKAAGQLWAMSESYWSSKFFLMSFLLEGKANYEFNFSSNVKFSLQS